MRRIEPAQLQQSHGTIHAEQILIFYIRQARSDTAYSDREQGAEIFLAAVRF